MVSYQRPDFPDMTFRDASGALINYGRRWPERIPPEETYSVVAHPERFAPLHGVADALIDYLTKRYEATSSEDPAFAEDLLSRHNDVLRAVRVTPAGTDAAPLTFIYTNFPGVLLHAGLLHDFPFPDCGCDACDETAESEIDRLEELVLAVAEGRYRESYDPGVEGPQLPGGWTAWPGPASTDPDTAPFRLPGAWAGYRIAADSSSRSGGRSLGSSQTERLVGAKARLDRLKDGWKPWPLRPL